MNFFRNIPEEGAKIYNRVEKLKHFFIVLCERHNSIEHGSCTVNSLMGRQVMG